MRVVVVAVGVLLVSSLTAPTAVFGQPGGGPGGGPPGGGPPGPLGEMVAPPENPVTPSKAILGKLLFWDAQLSADDTVACGSCHLPEAGGSDPRGSHPASAHPGLDGAFGTADDIVGSVGVNAQDCAGVPLDDGIFFPERQVTGRKAQSAIGAGYSDEVFWDGRAPNTFFDPETGLVAIASGGALESQAVGPVMSLAEMSCDTRDWNDVRSKLQSVSPMAFALALTTDMEQALLIDPTYPDLFEAAFGTPEINAQRIAFAIATYERTLVPNQAPLDAFLGGDTNALTANQQQGLFVFTNNCVPCHGGAELSDGDYHYVGVRPVAEDIGRQAVTGLFEDRGRFKTPSLRNVALRAPYFHNGGKSTLQDVVDFYQDGGDFDENPDPLMPQAAFPEFLEPALLDFLENALTDPRVAQALPPFDRPTLRPYFRRGDVNNDGALELSDAIGLLGMLFLSTPIFCQDASDANDDGALDITDPITLLTRLFGGQGPLPAPSDLHLGPDPTADALDCATPPI